MMEVDVEVTRAEAVADDLRRPIDGSPAQWGYYVVANRSVRAQIPDDPFAAESVLRVAYQVVALRQGAVLVHGAGFAYGDRAVVAMGPSGAGKSTLASLCTHPVHGAQLLSDEVLLLHPAGWCGGTPFRSNLETPGAPGPALLSALLLLEKGDREHLEPVDAHMAVPALMSQLFKPLAGEVTAGEAARRLMAVIARTPVFRLTFRKHEAVGAFVRDWVHAGH